MAALLLLFLGSQTQEVSMLPSLAANMSLAYFQARDVRHLCYLSCATRAETKDVVNKFITRGLRASAQMIDKDPRLPEQLLKPSNIPVGVFIDIKCEQAKTVLMQASRSSLFDGLHLWFIANYSENRSIGDLELKNFFRHLNMSVNSDVVVANFEGDRYKLFDVFNFGKIQGNNLEWIAIGDWSVQNGMNFPKHVYKYYNRAEMLSDLGYTPGVPSITKAVAMLLNVLMEKHHFRLNYTIVGRWIGSPERNSTLAVTNSLYWREQDISCTSARIFPNWLDWVDIFFPAATTLETKFFYLIPDKGVGRYENRFLSPMSPSAWWCACATSLVCVAILAASAKIERRPEPRTYAFFSVFATTCQQEYEDGNEAFQRTFSSQGRRVVLLVIGLTSMLLYNYYTSSVVSWLLSAAAPTLQDLDSLINSDLELVFEDIGYTRGWLEKSMRNACIQKSTFKICSYDDDDEKDPVMCFGFRFVVKNWENPGFFYYSGHKNPKEDELRNKKVINAKRTVPLLQPAQAGIELVRNGGYAYHTEPYTANQAISKKFDDSELCELGALQMMQPAQVYIMAQKNSPYKEFFVWSLMRLQERGHMKVVKGRIGGHSLACSGRTPRALALGQAAPAFALLAEAMLLALIILIVEIVWHRFKTQTTKGKKQNKKKPINDN